MPGTGGVGIGTVCVELGGGGTTSVPDPLGTGYDDGGTELAGGGLTIVSEGDGAG